MAFTVQSGKFIQIMTFIRQLFYFIGVERVEAMFAKDVQLQYVVLRCLNIN